MLRAGSDYGLLCFVTTNAVMLLAASMVTSS
jgi:hypothetical protein